MTSISQNRFEKDILVTDFGIFFRFRNHKMGEFAASSNFYDHFPKENEGTYTYIYIYIYIYRKHINLCHEIGILFICLTILSMFG